jgi:hypothetical protein
MATEMFAETLEKLPKFDEARTSNLKFHNNVSVALFNYGTLRILVSTVTTPILVTMVKQLVKLWNPFLHKYGFNSHMRIVWLPWLPNFNP